MSAELEKAIEEAEDRIKAKETALKQAVVYMGKPTRWSSDPDKVVALANAFYKFLTEDY